jgi:hypothetical protein
MVLKFIAVLYTIKQEEHVGFLKEIEDLPNI